MPIIHSQAYYYFNGWHLWSLLGGNFGPISGGMLVVKDGENKFFIGLRKPKRWKPGIPAFKPVYVDLQGKTLLPVIY